MQNIVLRCGAIFNQHVVKAPVLIKPQWRGGPRIGSDFGSRVGQEARI